ncbi:hypothetical protein LXL04_010252 [Taraxacum kok-saghyz]
MSQKESGKRSQNQVAPPSFPPPSCPRCCSDNTKFCYYNNYTVTQPRYYCKDCRRYWTHGGAIRNIPTGGSTRKRGRIDTSSSTLQVLLPPPITWGMGAPDNNPTRGFACPSIGHGTFTPPVTETMISFNGGGGSNQTPYRFSSGSSGGELVGVMNSALGVVSLGFGAGALPAAPARLNPLSCQLSSVGGFCDFGFPVLQRPPQHLIPQNVWSTGQNMAQNSTSTTHSVPNNFAPAPAASANVVSVNEWCELNDIDYEGDHLQSYKPPSP